MYIYPDPVSYMYCTLHKCPGNLDPLSSDQPYINPALHFCISPLQSSSKERCPDRPSSYHTNLITPTIYLHQPYPLLYLSRFLTILPGHAVRADLHPL